MPIVDIQIEDNADNPQTHIGLVVNTDNKTYLDLLAKVNFQMKEDSLYFVYKITLKKPQDPDVIPEPLAQYLNLTFEMLAMQHIAQGCSAWQDLFKVIIEGTVVYVLMDTSRAPPIGATSHCLIEMFNQFKKNSLDYMVDLKSTLTLKSVVENVWIFYC